MRLDVYEKKIVQITRKALAECPAEDEESLILFLAALNHSMCLAMAGVISASAMVAGREGFEERVLAVTGLIERTLRCLAIETVEVVVDGKKPVPKDVEPPVKSGWGKKSS
jgi:hypothetical protein